MLPSGVQAQPPRQPSEAAYGSSGRPREVGAILRCVLTSYAIAARPHPLTCDAKMRLSPVATRRRRQAVTRRVSVVLVSPEPDGAGGLLKQDYEKKGDRLLVRQ